MSGEKVLHGSCLCGGVAFRVPGPAGPVTACHCTQCRKTSGHFAASFDADEATVEWLGRGTLRDHRLPSGSVRFFCGTCGSRIAFRHAGGDFSIEAGIIDGPTGGRLDAHIFVADKGDYYEIADGPAQHPGDLPG